MMVEFQNIIMFKMLVNILMSFFSPLPCYFLNYFLPTSTFQRLLLVKTFWALEK
jgi:hypothetical protein